MQKLPTPEDRERIGAAGAATGLGCSIVVTVVAFIGGGLLLDRWRDTTPVFTLIGVAIAVIASGYELYELARVGRSDTRPGPLTRQISRVTPKRARGVTPDSEE